MVVFSVNLFKLCHQKMFSLPYYENEQIILGEKAWVCVCVCVCVRKKERKKERERKKENVAQEVRLISAFF